MRSNEPRRGERADATVDEAMFRLVRAIVELRLPPLAVFFALFGTQIVLSVDFQGFSPWLPVVGVAALSVWTLIGVRTARHSWRQLAQVDTLLTYFGFVPSRSIRRWHLMVLLLLMAIPGWVGLAGVLTATSLMLFPLTGRASLKWLRFSLALLGGMILVGAIAGPSGLGWTSLVSAGRMAAAAGALGLVSLAILLGRVVDSASFIRADQRVLIWSLIPLSLLLFGDVSWVPIAMALLLFGIAPVIYYISVLLLLRGAQDRVRSSLSRSLRDQLQPGPNEIARREDCERESDGYYKVCAPLFSHVTAQRSERQGGTRGIVAWVGGSGDPMIPPSMGDAIVFRNFGYEANPMCFLPDRLGAQIRASLVELAPDLDIDALKQLRETLREAWYVRVMPAHVATMVAKLPWEHHELVVIPVSWEGQFVIPPGAGLHDLNKLPCHIDAIDVRILIDDRLVAAARNANRLDEETLRSLRDLLFNYRRILPACYEALHTSLIGEMREYRVPLLSQVERQSDTTEKTVRNLQQALNRTAVERLPEVLRKILRFEVIRMNAPDTTVVSHAQRKDQDDLSTLKNQKRDRLFSDLKTIEISIIQHLYGARAGKESEITSDFVMRRRLEELRGAITIAAEQGSRHLEQALGQTGHMPEYTGRAFTAITQGRTAFAEKYHQAISDMNNALAAILQAFREERRAPQA
jgi:hypothetical protein